jgi:hypothetical protein
MADGERYQSVLKNPGDWVALAALVPLFVGAFALPWISVNVKVRAFGTTLVDRRVVTLKLFQAPWYWMAILFAVLAAAVACFFLVRTRGAVTLGAGVYFLLFTLLFFFGAWYKINAIIGDITGTVRELPFVGQYLGALVSEISKRVLVVRLQSGYYVFITAGLLFVVGGALRLFTGTEKD